MSGLQIVTLLLAVSGALNVGFVAAVAVVSAGAPLGRALLAGGGAMGGALTLFFAGVMTYS